jgi:hypothetical protein
VGSASFHRQNVQGLAGLSFKRELYALIFPAYRILTVEIQRGGAEGNVFIRFRSVTYKVTLLNFWFFYLANLKTFGRRVRGSAPTQKRR